jgi:hypothetical protein
MKINITLYLILSVFSSYALGADETTIYGSGSMTCGHWTEVNKAGGYYQGQQWVAGWVSAYAYYNKSETNVLKETDFKTIVSFIDKYCIENPQKHIVHAAEALQKSITVEYYGGSRTTE